MKMKDPQRKVFIFLPPDILLGPPLLKNLIFLLRLMLELHTKQEKHGPAEKMFLEGEGGVKS